MNKKEQVIQFLKDNKDSYNNKEATIGIDSTIDKIVRIVHIKSQENEKVFFDIGITKSELEETKIISQRIERLENNP